MIKYVSTLQIIRLYALFALYTIWLCQACSVKPCWNRDVCLDDSPEKKTKLHLWALKPICFQKPFPKFRHLKGPSNDFNKGGGPRGARGPDFNIQKVPLSSTKCRHKIKGKKTRFNRPWILESHNLNISGRIKPTNHNQMIPYTDFTTDVQYKHKQTTYGREANSEEIEV